ncbi:MAG: sigma-70 family RNA polymerase sigma factor [Asticcacaulis sp.]|uniref:sigma-70 family RNA polymerase sigma factor n=1 Tax=Asticcacaulis sp. TaxID=1872648 RepID=UPI0039E477D0
METDKVEQLYNLARSVGVLDRHIGARLRSRRILRQMSEQWLADALGLRLDQLEAMEAGTLRIGPRRLAFVAAALDVADRYFFLDFTGKYKGGERRREWLRDVDCWFRDQIAPNEGLFLTIAKDVVGSRGVARDLVHDVYASLLVGDRWQTIDHPMAYITKAVVQSARRFVARSKVVPLTAFETGADGGGVKCEAPLPDVAAAHRDHLRRVLAALNKLPTKSRRVMMMRKVDGLSGPEIAARLGLSLKGVEIHITRGKVALNKLLEADEVGLGLGAVLSEEESPADTSIAD